MCEILFLLSAIDCLGLASVYFCANVTKKAFFGNKYKNEDVYIVVYKEAVPIIYRDTIRNFVETHNRQNPSINANKHRHIAQRSCTKYKHNAQKLG